MLAQIMLLKKYLVIFVFIFFAVIAVPVNFASAQLPTIQDLVLYSNNLLHNNSTEQPVASCIRLDGRCVFKVAFPKSELSYRVNEIQYRLNGIKSVYLRKQNPELEINYRAEGNNVNVYVLIDNNPTRLLTITQQDANFQGLTVEGKASSVVKKLQDKLGEAKQQRKANYLIRQTIISIILFCLTFILTYFLKRYTSRIRQQKIESKIIKDIGKIPLINYLKTRQNWHLQEIKYRFLQVIRYLLWLSLILVILGLFPYTRTVQLIVITAIRLPLRVILIGFATYLVIRLFYSLVNKFSSTLIKSEFVLSPRANKRLQLRINTISQVSKSIATIAIAIVGFLIAIAAIGVNITPFLAGAGIIGLALSFASQSIIKDALNGFLIIFEDQYAVGDIINLNGVGGMVENINLRITQIRDAEGRLITIPNSEVKIVANLSSQWSRADLNIPLSYDIDLDRALEIITQVAEYMNQDPQWQPFILEPPQILGVENFSDRGIIIRVFIKTEPLKQWDVAREFRLRLQIALKEANIPLTPPQQIWLNRCN